jgi:N-methylhydantoinase B
MPGISSTLSEEGIVIPPTLLVSEKGMEETVLRRFREETRSPGERIGDLNAQVGANKLGVSRCLEFLCRYGEKAYDDFVESIITYSRDRVAAHLYLLPRGTGEAIDYLDGNDSPLPIAVKVQLNGATFQVDFSGTSAQIDGNANAPMSVTRSAVYYVFRCLLPHDIPANYGCYEAVRISALEGSLLNPRPPAAVSSGNVETSQRIVDVLLLALKDLLPQKIPAQGQGTMNNLTMGWQGATYYETIAGGMGGTPQRQGADAVQVHMTNTANTPVEALESIFPLRVVRTALREDSGGDGFHAGGMGVTRELLLMERAEISIQSERRKLAPKGIAGGKDGKRGKNYFVSSDGTVNGLPGRCTFTAEKGTKIILQTPGGGGWGQPKNKRETEK